MTEMPDDPGSYEGHMREPVVHRTEYDALREFALKQSDDFEALRTALEGIMVVDALASQYRGKPDLDNKVYVEFCRSQGNYLHGALENARAVLMRIAQ